MQTLWSWNSPETYLCMNHRIAGEIQDQIRKQILNVNLRGHFWFSSSGTTERKWIALSKEALLASAAAVNKHLEASSKDIWCLALPNFHVGGASIFARAQLSGSQVVHTDDRWNPHRFVERLIEKKSSLTSLVPTQVKDLVDNELKAPCSLRAAIVGGSALIEPVYLKARALGWPLLPSFGMTEVSSQVATAPLTSLQKSCYPPLKLLPHINAHLTSNKKLQIKSESLFTAIYYEKSRQVVYRDPKNAYWESDDYAELQNGNLIPLGRDREFIKVSGELVSLLRLNLIWQTHCFNESFQIPSTITSRPDERKGSQIVLQVNEPSEQTQQLVNDYNATVLPFERIERIIIEPLHLSPLGKPQLK